MKPYTWWHKYSHWPSLSDRHIIVCDKLQTGAGSHQLCAVQAPVMPCSHPVVCKQLSHICPRPQAQCQ